MKNLSLLGLVLLLASCAVPFGSPSAERKNGWGTLGIHIVDPSPSSRTVQADTTGVITSIDVTMNSQNAYPQKNFTIDTTALSSARGSQVNLEAGIWDLTLTAHFPLLAGVPNATRMVTIASQTVAAGSTLMLDVSLYDFLTSGTGSFSLTVNLPVEIDYVSAQVFDSLGNLVPPDQTPAIAVNSATFSAAGLTAGHYDLVITLKRGGAGGTLAGDFREAVNVWDGLVSDKWINPTTGALEATRNFVASELLDANASLANLVLTKLPSTPLTMDAAFSSNLITYAQIGSEGANEVSVTATKSLSSQKVEYRINAGAWSLLSSGVPGSFDTLNVGSDTLEVRVTAPDKQSTKSYTLTLVHPIPAPVLPSQAVGTSSSLLIAGGGVTGAGYNLMGLLGTGSNVPNIQSTFIPMSAMGAGIAGVWAGDNHTMVLKTGGWGYITGLNDFGQYGDGSVLYPTTPARLSPVGLPAAFDGAVKTMAAGKEYSMVVKTDGTLWAAGQNGFGQLGISSVTDPQLSFVQVGVGNPAFLSRPVHSVAAGFHHTLILRDDGSLWATGRDDFGQLGDGGNTQQISPVRVGLAVPAFNAFPVVQAAVGQYFSLALTTDGTLWGWGQNTNSALTSAVVGSSAPVVVTTGVTEVSAGDSSTFIRMADGKVMAVGSNLNTLAGTLGTGSVATTIGAFETVTGFDGTANQKAARLAVGNGGMASHQVILKDDGTFWAVGYNTLGQLGLGDQSDRTLATKIDATVTFDGNGATGSMASMSIPPGGSANLSSNGFSKPGYTFQGWNTSVNAGGTAYGPGAPYASASATLYAQWTMAGPQLSAGGYQTLLVKPDGSLWGAGAVASGDGTLGEASGAGSTTLIMTVASNVASVSTGGWNTMIVKTDGTLWGSGQNAQGQLGMVPTSIHGFTQVTIPGKTVAAVSAKTDFTMALMTDGSLWAAGYGQQYQLGDGVLHNTNAFAQVMTGVQAVSTGVSHTLILKQDGSVWGVGQNLEGQLGDGTTTNQINFTLMLGFNGSPGQKAKAIAAGNLHSLVLREDDTLWATGSNNVGQLGVGDNLNKSTPIQVLSVGANVRQISGGNFYSMVLLADGSVLGAGSNTNGQLGDNTIVDHNSFAPYTGFDGTAGQQAQAIAAGWGNFALIQKIDGSDWATGQNANYQLGLGNNTEQHIAVQFSP